MELHLDFDLTRSTADVSTLFLLWVEYCASRKRRGDLLRLVVKSLDLVLNEEVSARMPDGRLLLSIPSFILNHM